MMNLVRLSHGTGDDGSGSSTEYSLEDQECPERNAVRKHCASIVCLCCDSADFTEEAVSCTEHDTETNQPERPEYRYRSPSGFS